MATLIEIVEIAEDGSVLTPESLRKEVGLDVEARLVVSVVDGTLVIEPFEASVKRAQALAAPFLAGTPSLADELVAERHEEAERE